MIDLNVDWLLKDIATPSVYYGYTTTIGATGGNCVWSIRKVTTSGGVDTVSWSNNHMLSYGSVWDERVNCFIAPTASSGLTYSVSLGSNSFFTSSILSIAWTDISGVDTYRIRISDHNNLVYNYLGGTDINPYVLTTPYTEVISRNSYTFKGVGNMTYSVLVEAFNMAGTGTGTPSTVTIHT